MPHFCPKNSLYKVKKNPACRILAPRRGCFGNHLPLHRVRILAERFCMIERNFPSYKKIPTHNRRGFSLILLYFYMEIHPNAFATELIRIMTANTGHRYWTMIWNTLFLWNFPSP